MACFFYQRFPLDDFGAFFLEEEITALLRDRFGPVLPVLEFAGNVGFGGIFPGVLCEAKVPLHDFGGTARIRHLGPEPIRSSL